jgi:hypothetical protein
MMNQRPSIDMKINGSVEIEGILSGRGVQGTMVSRTDSEGEISRVSMDVNKMTDFFQNLFR